ncbi:SulP family inorganic anion transporter [Aurantibacillus circumpalustris]|uniref:SulP family inorganic anion transporter n=1 Tax=Aurantibacillus circumpalustris TaxID=3036359 RepID=UPI00295A6CFC|nr:SulP family inorganic anion transporter [Aurantibacillus circumpalustris]
MNCKNILADFKSGLVVFLVALPLCLGIALACGIPLFSGIISGVIGGVLVTVFSGSKYSVSGPAAGLTTIVISAISQLGSFETFLAAIVFAGVLQISFGILKAGGIGNYIPNSVIKGMLAGIGLILISKQLPHLIGYHTNTNNFYFKSIISIDTFNDVIDQIDAGVIIIGIVSLSSLIIAEKGFYKKNKILSNVPGPLLAVLLGILLTTVFNYYPGLTIDNKYLVHLPKIASFSDFKSNLSFPNFTQVSNIGFWVIVFTLAVVASLETLLGIEAIDKLDPDKNESNTNKELLAQGIGNIVSGFIGGLPLTSATVRSSANIDSGAKSKLSAIFHALFLLGSVVLLPKILALIPNTSLAAILTMTGFKLTRVALYKKKWKIGFSYFFPFITTIIAMLITDLLKGVFVGILVAVVFIIRDNIKFYFESSIEIKNGIQHYFLKLPQQVTFFNKGYLINYFKTINSGSKVIIDGTVNKTINNDAKDVITDFIVNSTKRNIEVVLINFPDENTQHTNGRRNN